MNVNTIRTEWQPSLKFVPEDDPFLDLFPHRSSYIWAEEHDAGKKPVWNTEHHHPLSDRLIRQGGKLYGVRFGKITHYLMIDIDRHSLYHPANDEFAIDAIVAALEPLGLSHYIPITSSYSGGLHLYFPFYQGQKSWAIARAAAALLEAKNLRPLPGQLELFPHPRRYAAKPSEYNAHRLPLQVGSYLVNRQWETCYTTESEFIRRWQAAENSNDVDTVKVERTIKQFERRGWGFIKESARKFLNDLNADIEPGWTGYGQTNAILGRIALREYIFHHVTHPSGEILDGVDLAYEIAEIAEHLPGYHRWCRHKHEIIKLAFYWARSVEGSSKYYRYGGKKILANRASVELSWNQKQASEARERIKAAVASLIAADEFPDGVKARFEALKSQGVGSKALYCNKALWHPDEMLEPASAEEFPLVSDVLDQPRSLEPTSAEEFPPIALISFIGRSECPPPEGNSDSPIDSFGGRGGLSTDPPQATGIEYVKTCIQNIRKRQQNDPPPDSAPPDEHWFGAAAGWEGWANG